MRQVLQVDRRPFCGYSVAEEILRLESDDTGEWAGQLPRRACFVATPSQLNATRLQLHNQMSRISQFAARSGIPQLARPPSLHHHGMISSQLVMAKVVSMRKFD
jgi:hypothetical protein